MVSNGHMSWQHVIQLMVSNGHMSLQHVIQQMVSNGHMSWQHVGSTGSAYTYVMATCADPMEAYAYAMATCHATDGIQWTYVMATSLEARIHMS